MKKNKPLKSIDKPDTGLLSLNSAIAFVTNLSSFTDDDIKLRWRGWADDRWPALASLAKEAFLETPETKATPALKALWEVEMQGLTLAIWRLEAAFAAISNKPNLSEENKYLQNKRLWTTTTMMEKQFYIQVIDCSSSMFEA